MMRLHTDKAAFGYIIDEVSSQHGIRRDVLEKDYYVTLLLKELTHREKQGYAYFKGGTALYKALKSIRRFSEDIDLTVDIGDCVSGSQAKKRLVNATEKFESLSRSATIENRRGSITCQYQYESLYALDEDDALQRFGNVRVEGTSFTVSEPIEEMVIAPHLYELSNDDRKAALSDYGVEPFGILTITRERIFTDKIFAAEFYFEREEFFDVSKHVYDLAVLMRDERIVRFLKDGKRLKDMIAYKREEESRRKGGVSADLKIAQFSMFDALGGSNEFKRAFDAMQKIYVFDVGDRLSCEYAIATLKRLRDSFVDIE